MMHVIYVPGALIVGLVIGWILGANATRKALANARDKARE
jgi:hypothetical protein